MPINTFLILLSSIMYLIGYSTQTVPLQNDLHSDWSVCPIADWTGAEPALWLHAAWLLGEQKNTVPLHPQREAGQHPAVTSRACIPETEDCASCHASVPLVHQGAKHTRTLTRGYVSLSECNKGQRLRHGLAPFGILWLARQERGCGGQG